VIEYRFDFEAMASINEVRLCAPSETIAGAWVDAAVAEVRRVECKYSRYRSDSVTAEINRCAGADAVAVDHETAALLDFGCRLHAESEGRFDLTSGVLRRAWDFRAQRVPAPAELASLLPLVGWDQVQWQRPWLRLPRAEMQIDFGGIGKEYAADRAATILAERGARHGFINLGGDVRGIGAMPGGGAWRIGIRHPRRSKALIGGIDVTTGAVATSGDYERFFERDGVRYCHILDPRSGMPATCWQSVSIAAPICVAAGACATIAMLMPVEEALDFLRRQDVQYLAVAADGAVFEAQ